ncbi:transmembrane protein 154 isoform X2 [Rhineura floridana]|uniref:transmembrane protein 154 isoform X2 n=1 Tax=Rhineura floridana TaxID=261503 RepID=UPI002AC885F6|nr:transmembrane protein 154 isoform X2 [Rhineura floridana]
MQKHNFMLSLVLLLSKRLACCGSTTAMAEEGYSGDGLQLSTIIVTPTLSVSVAPGSSTPFVFLTTSDQKLQADTMPTDLENPETESTATTETTDLHPALIFGVPAILLLVMIILLVVFIVRRQKQKQSKQDELGSENCKSPIFEEDTPSVMEIEMEELDKWMNSLKRNAECEYLPPVKEEKDCSASPR